VDAAGERDDVHTGKPPSHQRPDVAFDPRNPESGNVAEGNRRATFNFRCERAKTRAKYQRDSRSDAPEARTQRLGDVRR
jgi:hypothetical protein